jgi:ketosteroid isomerase-like protein
MDSTDIRALLDRHWAASDSGDQDAEHDIYTDDVVVEYPQSGEVIHGRHNIQELRSKYPAKKRTFTVRAITGSGDVWVTEYVLSYDGKPAYTVSIMRFEGDKVVHESQYFADPFEAPAWRADLVEHE